MVTTHQLQVERRESHRDNQVYELTTHQLQVERRESHRDNQVYGHHTPATGGEERVIEPIKCMHSPHTSYRWRGESLRANQVYALTTHQLQVERRESHRANQVYGDYFTRSAMGFLMTIESQDLGLTSHPKDSAC